LNKLDNRERSSVLSVIVILSLAIASRWWVFSWPWYREVYAQLPGLLQWLEQPVRQLLIVTLGMIAVHRIRPGQILQELGLIGSIPQGLLFGFFVTSPMLLGPLLLSRPQEDISGMGLLFGAGIWVLAEEILFRGYALRQLLEKKLRFWPAVLLISLVFGVLHLGNAAVRQLSLGDQLFTVLVVSAGGVLFAWLYVRWEFNLWVPFAVHGFMNLWWSVFDVAAFKDTPLGSGLGEGIRLLSVALAIAVTHYRARQSR
jgi:membrane protease YdiL (CAAX protease family)